MKDVILDTDAYNEIDDQFAIAWLLRSGEKLNTLGLCAAPFLNKKSVSPADGMQKSYDEIKKLLTLAGREDVPVYAGSQSYLPDDATPVDSPAAAFIAAEARAHDAEHPLYIAAIGAITNVASAILCDPAAFESGVTIVWLGGHAHHLPKTGAWEFNMMQDLAAARVVFDCPATVVQLPCRGCVDRLTTTGPELLWWLADKNPLADYLARNTIAEAESYAAGKPWSRVIWDVSAVAWLLDDEGKLVPTEKTPAPVPQNDRSYAFPAGRREIECAVRVNRDAIFERLFSALTE
ncbi:MAG: nucleoside hydrolase [Clostridia bacterium]|nr:nucleoside hydrolase [Clostridia bacterium]